MKIYNSLTREKCELPEKRIGIYVCGPTVYDEPHIGHARSAYVFDFIVKYLKYWKNSKVTFVRNVTDIDDKIVERARKDPQEEDLKTKVKRIAEKYLKSYHEDMDLLGLARPDKEPKATETISDMIKFITVLLKRGYAYESAGGVYFDVRKFKDYGRLSHQSLDKMEEGVRVSVDRNKRDPLDFALWKTAKEDEPSWDSPWGEGRPGWHIECSVMSTKFLGNNFLIHGGGLDLIFPHHENEIAQTVCAGKKSAKCWIHNGLLTIEGQKMSKSLGNFITIKDFVNKHKKLDYLKLLFLSSHYRHPVDYTDEKIEKMKRIYDRFRILLQKLDKKFGTRDSKRLPTGSKSGIKEIEQRFEDAMDDDFNTPLALSVLFDLAKECNIILDESKSNLRFTFLRSAKKAIDKMSNILGLCFEDVPKEKSAKRIALEEAYKASIKELIDQREEARKNKDFKKADRIRKDLLEKGIIVEDTKEGPVWRKKV